MSKALLKSEAPATAHTRSNDWLWGTLLFTLTCLAYLPVLHAGFVWDDVYMVTENPMLRTKQGLYDLWFTNRFADPYRITMTAFWLEWQLWGNNPLGYHLVNVLTHAVGSLLLWRLFQKLAFPGAWLAAAVFAIHPVCAASVAWVSELKNTASIIFYLLTLLCYLRFEQAKKPAWYALTLFTYICALMSKGSVVMLPVVLLLLCWWQRRHISRPDLLRTAPFFLLSLAAGLMTIWFQNHRAIAGGEVQNLDPLGRLAGAAWAVWFYLWKAWIPVNLSAVYPQWHIDSSSLLAWAPALLLCAALLACWSFRNTWGRPAAFAAGYFIVTLFPVMGFFDMYILVYCRVVDHWQYLALPAVLALATCSATSIFQKISLAKPQFKTAGPITASALLVLLGAATWIRAEVYCNEENLWSDTIKKDPGAWMAHSNLGNALNARGKTEEAIRCYEAALHIKTNFPDAHSNLGNALVTAGRVDEALLHLAEAVRLQPNMPTFHFNYGAALAEKGLWDQALEQYSTVLQIKPNHANAHNNIAHVLLKQRKPKEACEHALLAIQTKPDSSEAHYNAGSALSELGRTQDAISHFEIALQLRPDFAAAHYDLGLALAMSGRPELAIPHFQELIKLKPAEAVGHSSLATAFASLKKFDEAIAEFNYALALNPTDAQTHGNLATALTQSGKLQEALPHFETAIKLKPGEPDILCSYAWVLAQLGKRTEALAQYQQAALLLPNHPGIQNQIRALGGNPDAR